MRLAYPFFLITLHISPGLLAASVSKYNQPLLDKSLSATGNILLITLRPFSPPAQAEAIPSLPTSSSGVGTYGGFTTITSIIPSSRLSSPKAILSRITSAWTP
ncbi:hypothetical protein AQUCO_02600402v1 [Aquilegia coerulea]|uniref:Legume lectin domain-containing protein n=1 Tax=Aquilegia coerulea TaxID=218851 RepID=A0A2G5D8T0_AQUCA|nr:hypothetical protein AQUCO_02600402v1 [Aquilegia coerulea]